MTATATATATLAMAKTVTVLTQANHPGHLRRLCAQRIVSTGAGTPNVYGGATAGDGTTSLAALAARDPDLALQVQKQGLDEVRARLAGRIAISPRREQTRQLPRWRRSDRACECRAH